MDKENKITTSKCVYAGSRLYYFDIKEDKNGERYLSITEASLGRERQRSRIFIFPEDFEAIKKAFIDISASFVEKS